MSMVGNRTVTLRQEPSPRGAVLDKLKPGTPVDVIDRQGKWARVKAGDVEGFVLISMLDEVFNEIEPEVESGKVAGSKAPSPKRAKEAPAAPGAMWFATFRELGLDSELRDVPYIALAANEKRGESSLGVTRTSLLYALASADKAIRDALFVGPQQWTMFQQASGIGDLDVTRLERPDDFTISPETAEVLSAYRAGLDEPPFRVRSVDLTLAILSALPGVWDSVLSTVGVSVPESAERLKVLAVETEPPPEVRFHGDAWTDKDQLGFGLYARAIAEFIRRSPEERPLAIGIQAPWGQGKTSLMRMIQRRIEDMGRDARADSVSRPAAAAKLDLPEEGQITRRTLWALVGGRELGGRAKGVRGADLEPAKLAYPTVWFNAWRYQGSEQIWAGLAHVILSGLTDQIPNEVDRQLFWLRLQWNRLDRQSVKTDILRVVFKRTLYYLPLVLLVWLAAFALGPSGFELLDPKTIFPLGGLSTLLAGAVAFWKGKRTALDEHVDENWSSYFREPDYEGKMGFLHLVEQDMATVKEELIDKDHPAVVFIDDLDRCSPTRVAEIIEALNLFVSTNLDRFVFILGMDAEIVSASLEVAHKDIIERLSERRHELGWQFMDKFIQMPFVIPPPSSTQQDAFLRRLMGIPINEDERRVAADALDNLAAFSSVLAGDGLSDGPMAESMPDLGIALVRDESGELLRAGEQVLERAADQFADKEDDFLKELREYRLYLRGNPRAIKRAVNLYRFHLFMAWARKLVGLPNADTRQLACWIIVLLRWPSFVRWMQRTRSSEHEAGALLKQVVEIAADSDDIQAFRKSLVGSGITATGWDQDGQLLEFLKEDSAKDLHLGEASERGLW